MAIRQYIGARYVPRFVGAYDPTQIYEALDVVDNGSGTSYIARKNVPANTPLTNTDYWFVYGASSGAIIQLQNDMIQAQNDITGLDNDINAVEGRLTTDEGNITALQTSLGKVIDRLERRFILLGDSYANRTNSASKTYVQLFKAALGLDNDHLYDSNIAGAAFAHTSVNYKFITLLQSLTPSVTNPDSITDIIVVGGANDAGYTEANTKAAIAAFNTYAKANYPNAKITLMPCGLTFTASAMLNQKKVYNTWCKAQYLGINYIANSEYILRNAALLDPADKCHPSADGVDVIANALINWVQGQTVEASYSEYIPGNTLSAETMSGLTQFTVSSPTLMNRRHNGSVTICGRNGGEAFTVVSSVSMNFPNTGGGGIRVTLSDGCMAAGCDTDNPTYAGIGVDPDTGKVYPFACMIRAYVSYTEFDCYFQTGVPVADGVHRMAMYLTISLTD